MAKKNQESAEFEELITLYLDDDTEMECAVIAIFEANNRDYIALLPTSGPKYENGEVLLYRYSETEGAEPEPILDNIETDEEFEIVSDAFDELLDSAEYDEIVTEEE